MKFQKFREATKDMTPAKKREYIWMYYKWHIIAVVAVIALGIYSAHEFAIRRDPLMHVILTRGVRTPEVIHNLEDTLNEALLTPETKSRYSVVIRPLTFTVEPGIDIVPDEAQVVMLMMAVGDMDIIVLDRATFEHFISLEALAPLDEFGVELPADAIEWVDGAPLGLDARAFDILAPVVGDQDLIVASGVGSTRPEEVSRFLEFGLE